MEIEQSFSVAYPLDDVWASFHDTPGIVACLPGASLAAPPDNGQLKLTMTVKLGPIVANFAGDGEMTLDEAAKRGSVSGGGVDRKSASRVKGVAAFALHALAPRETRIDVTVDYTIAGTLAQFSRGGIVKELATRMTEAFAQNLKVKLDAAQVAPAPGGGDNAAALDTGAATVTAPADAHAQATAVNIAAQNTQPAIGDGPTDSTLAQPAAAVSQAAPVTVEHATIGTPSDAAEPVTAVRQPAPAVHSGVNAQTAAVEPTRQKIMQSIAAAPAAPASAAGTTPAASAAHGATTRAPQSSSSAPMPQNAPLDLGNLFWKMLWARVRGWLGFGASSR
jgi:carbon monoxide dehydrogenase subunit G